MLDNVTKQSILFNVNVSNNINQKNDALVLSGCKVKFLKDVNYSELDENNYIYINNNDYNCDAINIELNFDYNYKKTYFEFYINCIAIRIDNKAIFKDNIYNKYKVYTKINKNGKLSIGIGYFLKSLDEHKEIKECKSFLIEGLIALDKKKNVYGFMCEVIKEKDSWNLSEGNTYIIHKKTKINNFYH